MSWSRYEGHRPGGSSHSSGVSRSGSGLASSGKVHHIKEGDWECPDAACGNINFSKRSKCHRCGIARPRSGDSLHDASHFDGPPGLFKQGDWTCAQCGNVNWARRDRCNICNALKPVIKTLEPRTGRGGGHYDMQDPADRNKHDSDNEEFDEFGRKKKKRGAYDNGTGSSFQTPRNPFMNIQSHEMETRGGSSAPRRGSTAHPYSSESTRERGGPPPGESHPYASRGKGDPIETNVRFAFPPAPKARRPSSSSDASSSSSGSSASSSPASSRSHRKRSGRSRSRSRSISYSKDGKNSGKDQRYGQNSRVSSNHHTDR
ncbi:ran binding protein [Cardiosporidium cionae]|uniref:Ran binding protein n=1 Tax=Cardiosporidium cionae TaxID=476202 RepID=A0ABQ7J5H3_9APIC|nr:ran binding protein [Cardiosporidium cionae]|eukprot:KAF8819231.1 ran binding protein [Cardiosporidium cionae]